MRKCEKLPTAVPPSTAQFVVGAGDVPQQVPRAVTGEPPSDVTVAPRIADVPLTTTAVGEVTVGTLCAEANSIPKENNTNPKVQMAKD